MNKISAKQFLKEKLNTQFISPNDRIQIEQVLELMQEFATVVRDKQIMMSAVGAAHHTSIIRGTPAQLNNDLDSFLDVCKVKII